MTFHPASEKFSQRRALSARSSSFPASNPTIPHVRELIFSLISESCSPIRIFPCTHSNSRVSKIMPSDTLTALVASTQVYHPLPLAQIVQLLAYKYIARSWTRMKLISVSHPMVFISGSSERHFQVCSLDLAFLSPLSVTRNGFNTSPSNASRCPECAPDRYHPLGILLVHSYVRPAIPRTVA